MRLLVNRVTLSLAKGDTAPYFDKLNMTPINTCYE